MDLHVSRRFGSLECLQAFAKLRLSLEAFRCPGGTFAFFGAPALWKTFFGGFEDLLEGLEVNCALRGISAPGPV